MLVTGIIRRIDELGRIAIPKEIRRALNINADDPIEMYIDKEIGALVLKPYET